MARAALGLAIDTEQLIAARRSRRIKVLAGYRLRGGKRQDVELERPQLGGDLIVVGVDLQMPQAVRGGEGELCRVVEARIEEASHPVHIEICYEGVPVCH